MLTVFYNGEVHSTHLHWTSYRGMVTPRSDLYNKAYIYNDSPAKWQTDWSRSDGTPVLLEHVPKEYRTMVLLLS